MDQKKQRLAAVACFVLFLAVLLCSSLFSKTNSSEWANSGNNPVVISEILPSNRTYPTPDGQHLDFVEIHNLSADPVDISGYMLSDDLSSIGYTFPDDTVLPPYGYAVCWCSPGSEDSQYANFGVSREGGETIYLYNSANVVVDEKALGPTAANTSLIRVDAVTWEEAAFATPGYANTEEGYHLWLDTVTGGDIQITITEVMTDNSCVASAPDTQPCDWVELTNTGNAAVNLDGAFLSDDPAERGKWRIHDLTLAPGQSAVIPCAGSEAGGGEADFALSSSGCTVTLSGSDGNIISQVVCPTLDNDRVWSMQPDGTYLQTDTPTPGMANTDENPHAYRASQAAAGPLAITEVMPANDKYMLQSDGS